MKKKRILAIIMSLTLAFSVVGCGKSNSGNTSSTEATTKEDSSSSDSKDGFKKIENTEKNVLELGAKQTKEIKAILEKYGIKTAYNGEHNTNVPIHIAKDENDCSYDATKGYNISTTGDVKINDGGEHEYQILHNAYVDKENNNEVRYLYQITIDYPTTEEFKLDNFKMFKELVQEVQGSDYDFASLDKWMSEHIKKIQSKEKQGASARDVGSFHEGIEGGSKRAGKNTNMIIFSFSLRK
ncbi:hypothetical protein [Clostridium cibarium]|uniref:Lipoprotein n=1 Tax=Clostridium cibarium TaxID=2762247 RepID=A0ABR8PPN2_9CLOT|nr:hypothetical protein [Clostridium cibarium]MBD7910129.1 hypothetical protein [Clostridium cibarium]